MSAKRNCPRASVMAASAGSFDLRAKFQDDLSLSYRLLRQSVTTTPSSNASWLLFEPVCCARTAEPNKYAQQNIRVKPGLGAPRLRGDILRKIAAGIEPS
jgi:hypothetical protein